MDVKAGVCIRRRSEPSLRTKESLWNPLIGWKKAFDSAVDSLSALLRPSPGLWSGFGTLRVSSPSACSQGCFAVGSR